MSLRGRLEDLSVAEILHVVGAARRSGLLQLEAPEGAVEILFRDGAVVAIRGASMPTLLAELLSRAGALEAEAREKAVALAQSSGVPIDEALVRLGTAASLRAQQAIEAEIARRLPEVVALKSGNFEFSLRSTTDPVRLDFGALELKSGIPVWQLGASRTRVRSAPEGLGESTGARRARLIMDEERIALPGSGGRIHAGETAAAEPPKPAARQARRTILHGLVSSPLRQRLLATLAEESVGALAVTSLADIVAGVEAARSRDERVGLVCHAGHPDLPGIELLARLRSIDASAPAALLVSASWPVARRAATMDRARHLGVRIMAVVDERSETDAPDLAARLLQLLEPAESAEPPTPGSATSDLGLAVDEPPPAGRRRQSQDLVALARGLAAAGEAAEIACELLSVTGEHFDSCYLFFASQDDLELAGFARPTSGPLPDLARGARLSARGADFLSAAIRTGSPIDGPRPNGPGDALVLRLLHASDATRVTVLPLLASGTCFGALAAVASEQAGSTDDLAALSGFVMESSPALWEALARGRRRHETRRSRT